MPDVTTGLGPTSSGSGSWAQQTNPKTGMPYASQAEYDSVNGTPLDATVDPPTTPKPSDSQAFKDSHTTGYNFGQGNVWTPADVGGTTGGYIFFGSSTGGDSKTWVKYDQTTGQWRPATDAEKHDGGWSWDGNGYMNQGDAAKVGQYEVPSNGGYIDPNTGKITYSTGGSAYGGGSGNVTKDYWYDQDYGLGPNAKGVIPVQYDQNGTPTKFYAGTGGGGGQVFDDLSKAIASVAQYKSWYDQEHPAGTPGSQIAPTDTSAPAPIVVNDPQKPGVLTSPGTGETYFGQTGGFYTQPTNAQTLYDATKDIYGQPTNAQTVFNDTPNQPTESQQLWNKYSGMYGNPNYLDDYYNTEQQKTQTALERRAASAGVGDSSSAARASAGIGLDFAGKKLLAREGFTTTGMGLAGQADASGVSYGTLRGNLANSADNQQLGRLQAGQTAAQGADSANLNKIASGQVAATSAENQMINRNTGSLNSATTLAQDQSALVAAGLDSATAANYASQLAVLQGEWQAAGLTAQQQYQKAQDLATSMGVVLNSALNYYLSTKFGGGTSTSTGAGANNPYSSPFANG